MHADKYRVRTLQLLQIMLYKKNIHGGPIDMPLAQKVVRCRPSIYKELQLAIAHLIQLSSTLHNSIVEHIIA